MFNMMLLTPRGKVYSIIESKGHTLIYSSKSDMHLLSSVQLRLASKEGKNKKKKMQHEQTRKQHFRDEKNISHLISTNMISKRSGL